MTNLTAEETPVLTKTRELCEAIVEQPGFQELIGKIDAFTQNEEIRAQYDNVLQKQELLQRKQQSGQELSDEEIADFEKERDALLQNPVANGFMEAQNEMRNVQQSVLQYVTKTFEIGRVPTEEDIAACACGGGCSCG